MWAIVGIVVPFLVVLGVMFMQMHPCGEAEFRLARLCFVTSALILEVATLVSVIPLNQSPLTRLAIMAVVSILILRALHYSNCWIRARANTAEAARGDLRLTVLHCDYDDSAGELIARLMFFNADSVQRTVIGVGFLYRASKAEKGWEFHSTGPYDAPFIGHIDPIKLVPKSEEIRTYRAQANPDRFNKEGAQIGLHVTFSVPGRHTDSAHVIAMEIVPSKPARHFPKVENVSLDEIGDSKKIAELIQRTMSSPPESVWSRFRGRVISLLDY
jgi:hypothetical protein